MRDWTDLRDKAKAAADQLATGAKEWPDRPSAQRLALFLAASPDVVLDLLAALDDLRRVASPIPSDTGKNES